MAVYTRAYDAISVAIFATILVQFQITHVN